MEKKRCTAIILAAGTGSRMKSKVAKQFMLLKDKPVLYYSLKAVEDSEVLDDCIIVTGEDMISYVEKEIVKAYGFQKVVSVIAGGTERFLSVSKALQFICKGGMAVDNYEGYVFIHDAARPFLTEQMIKDTYEAVEQYGACVIGTPSKDTVKIADDRGFAAETPERKYVWNVQTPQVFEMQLITEAYHQLLQKLSEPGMQDIMVTDDASVLELFTDRRVKLVQGSYENIKITTPEDICVAEAFMNKNV